MLEVLVKVAPGAPRDAIRAVVDDGAGARRLGLAVTARPDGEAANRAVVRLVAESWQIAPSAVTITAGRHSRRKRLRLDVTPEKAAAVQRLLD